MSRAGRVFMFVFASLVLGAATVGGHKGVSASPAGELGTSSYLVSLLPASPDESGVDGLRAAAAARLRRTAPALDLLHANGQVTGFEEHAGDGFVRVEATDEGAGALRRTFGARAVREWSEQALRAHTTRAERLARLAAAGQAAGAAPLSITVDIGSSSISGLGPAERVVYATLLDQNGKVIARGQDKAEGGYYYLSFAYYNHAYVYPGFKVKLKSGTSTLNFKVPAVSIITNRATDALSGKAPRNANVLVTATHYSQTDTGSTSQSFPLASLVNGQGAFTKDYTAFTNLVGGDRGEVKYTVPGTTNAVTVDTVVPYVYGYLGRTLAGGVTNPSANATFTVKKPNGATAFTANVRGGLSGSFSLELWSGSAGVALQPGMTLALNLPGVSAKLPAVTAKLNTAAKTVTGKGPAGAYIFVQTSQPYQTYYGRIDGTGKFSVSIASGGAVTAETGGYVAVYLPSGDLVYFTFA